MNLPAYRAIERVLVVLGGMFFAYLGYRLLIFGVSEGISKLEGQSAFFKITFSGTGAGLICMFFGAVILIISLYTGKKESRIKPRLLDFSSDQKKIPDADTQP